MTFREAVARRVLVFDGAMGTQIQRHQLKASEFGGKEGANDLLVLTRPDLIEDIHGRYFAVGCDVVETNTFGSSRLKLDEYGLGHRTYEVNFKAAIVARRAAEPLLHARTSRASSRARSGRPACCRPPPTRRSRQHHRRRARADLLRAGEGAHRGRRRRHHHRDPAGHPRAPRRGPRRRRLPARVPARRLHHRPADPHRRERPHAARHRHRRGARDAGAAAGGRHRPQLLDRPRRDARGGEATSPRSASHYVSMPARTPGCRRTWTGTPSTSSRRRRSPTPSPSSSRDFGVDLVGGCCGTTPEHLARGRGAPARARRAPPGPPPPRRRALLRHEGGAARDGARARSSWASGSTPRARGR